MFDSIEMYEAIVNSSNNFKILIYALCGPHIDGLEVASKNGSSQS
jgi:hypothetical protein